MAVIFRNGNLRCNCSREKDAAAFPFDDLDPTKLIPEELVPLQVIGRMVSTVMSIIFLRRPSRSRCWRHRPGYRLFK